MNIQKIDASAQAVSLWSGGTTTQLAIWPPEALYADRDFLWRLSSAVVELPESDFTPLPDYRRILMILDGRLELSHDGGPVIVLNELEQNTFDGASHTISRGQVTDFNLMMRKGRCDGRVEAQVLSCGECWDRKEVLSREESWQLIYCYQGQLSVTVENAETWKLEGKDALLVHCAAGETCNLCIGCPDGQATVIAANAFI